MSVRGKALAMPEGSPVATLGDKIAKPFDFPTSTSLNSCRRKIRVGGGEAQNKKKITDNLIPA